jgi:D-alanyl-D-alanine carboxypeptidase
MLTTRRDLLGLGLAAASVTAGVFRVSEGAAQTPASTRYSPLFPALDQFVEQYMRDMNSPGMTLVLADRDGVQRVTTYGFSDLERQRHVAKDELFQIGSISKSFLALVLLQLHQEGKLDFHKPIADYLPWFRVQTHYAPVTVHHLLTHSSGLSAAGELFPADSGERRVAWYAPGEHFYYNNMAFQLLGILAWTLDGRDLSVQIRARLFKPLGMTQSESTIDFDTRDRVAKSYAPFQPDRPYPRHGRLCEAPAIVTTNAAGSILSTARDMGAYVHMLVNKGAGLVSPESFETFSKRHIAAEDFGPGVGYGYGMAVDSLDGHKLIRHTGGMVSFMSSLMVDLDEGVGGFASINAQQEYRPNPVVRYALQLMRAQRAAKPLPASPSPNPASKIEKAAEYAGVFGGSAGMLEFASEGTRLFLVRKGARVAIEPLSDAEQFHVDDPAFDRFALIFGRENGTVVEVGWGPDWYTNSGYTGPREFSVPAAWQALAGHYRTESAWTGSVHIVIRKGQLLYNGTSPLAAEGDLFRFHDEEFSTDWIRFGPVVNGRCMRLSYSGVDCQRVFVP